MKQTTDARLSILFFICILLVHQAFAKNVAFNRIQLTNGISLEVPSHWTAKSQDTRKNISAAGLAIMSNAGIEEPSGEKINLLIVNATPDPSGATIRVSITSPPSYTQAYLARMTATELKETRTELANAFKQLESSGGPKVTKLDAISIEKFNGYNALVISYTREGMYDPSPWQVTQFKIPKSNRLIEITISHRKSDEALWKPILERVKRSIKF